MPATLVAATASSAAPRSQPRSNSLPPALLEAQIAETLEKRRIEHQAELERISAAIKARLAELEAAEAARRAKTPSTAGGWNFRKPQGDRIVDASETGLVERRAFPTPKQRAAPARTAASWPTKKEGFWRRLFEFWVPTSFEHVVDSEIFVFTEWTDAGRARGPASTEHPQSYLAQSAGYQARGKDVPNERAPVARAVERVLRASLGSQGLAPEEPGRRSDLVLVLHWGSYYRAQAPFTYGSARRSWGPEPGYNSEQTDWLSSLTSGGSRLLAESNRGGYSWRNPGMLGSSSSETLWVNEPLTKQELVERAALLVGARFAEELSNALAFESDDNAGRERARRRAIEVASRRPGTSFFRTTLDESFYFVVVSAFDGRTAAAGRRDLLWRTRIALTSTGVSLVDSMPNMIAAAAPYLGRDTGPDGAMLCRRYDQWSGIVLGEPEVIEWISEGPPKATSSAKREEKR